MDLALYIHIPFCLRRCAYCDFVSYAGRDDLHAPYAAALQKDMQQHKQQLIALYPSLRAATLYFGGGTPSLLPAESIAILIEEARSGMRLPGDAEITLEANPGAVDGPKLAALRAAGVNRLSLGVQSANAEELQLLERIHTWEEAVLTVKAAREAGFENINLDLIFGLPGQTRARWKHTIEAALDLTPEHLSLYALTLEPETQLTNAVARGSLPEPDADLAADIYEWTAERLRREGFWQYEISNWARGSTSAPEAWALPPTGKTESIGPWISRHNLLYWRNTAWLGIGVAAHSYLGHHRWSNVHDPEAYIAAVNSTTSIVADIEEITRSLELGETVMLGLRLAEGISEVDFRARFGVGLVETYSNVIEQYVRLQLLEWDGIRIRLTARGRLLGNRVFAAFLQDQK